MRKLTAAKLSVLRQLRNTSKLGRKGDCWEFQMRTLLSLRKEGMIEHWIGMFWYLTDKGREWLENR